ncbi:DNA mismatch repair protein MutS [Brucella pseudogrignonensis]|uniref:DNA mismatch repair protein MutS n=1 Tax=Brucella pseudogrignonensis TaxID=419475 RepID=UPI000CFC2473|nr:DNA mismatch repair protein MutS [Brucella pseudogrignonensis]MQP39719.1 DNA mismatch repair protein MutS [Ochrobactrum sp. MYb237]PQZ42533.1 DNA mismatch repair protein MutS [Brucella pseudogrignonensis]PRA41962.1 DNA mismatch repair protein MutS [Brucella pseudogrignonensis]PRA70612.1 DNA mismatch repair protein MutS [Brucella pseudogrignonensis]
MEVKVEENQVDAGENNTQETAVRLTPMMEQYIEIKAANVDSLLFYRMGDFYELFFDDAVEASRALGITLTKRGKHLGEDIPMCGVPVHASDDYLQRLIAKGYRVAVCEQVEDPAEAKKRGSKSVVRRDVIRLVTPGTITEEKLLDPSEANYLMALGRTKGDGALALAWIDISTGTFRVSETTDDRLFADVARIDPRELVVADTAFHDADLRPTFDLIGKSVIPQPATLFDSAAAENRIQRYFNVATLDGFGQFSRSELSAISGAIAYIEKTQIAERPPLMRPEREQEGGTIFIDPATRASLELARTMSGNREGSLLKAIDRTVTGGGARLLAERLTAPLTDPKAIALRLDAVSWFLSEQALCEGLRLELKGVPDMPRALSRLAVGRGGPRDLGALQRGFEAANGIGSLLEGALLPDELAQAREAIETLPVSFAAHIDRALAEEMPLLKRDGGFVRQGYNTELDEMRALRDQSRRVIAGLQADYIEETGIKTLKIKHNNVLGYFIEVTANNSGTMTDTVEAKGRFIHRQTMANAMRFTTTELAELESKIANAADRALSIELAIFEELTAEAVSHADSIRAAAVALSVFDVSASLAVLAEEQGYCRPLVDDSLSFNIVAGRHPVVEQALRRQAANPFVANDCDLSPQKDGGNGAIWLLTGPNMGGKSTFLRQNALIAIMAQMGSFVPAGSAQIGVVDRLFSRVGASDDLARGRSTFMVEMVETAAILNQAGERSLVILDEIGRGTATFDGLSIAWAAVEYLHEKNRCRALFATHFHEMTALSEKLDRLFNVTMRVKEWDNDVVFLHEVAKGAADRSYGVQVARLAGLPEAVVNRARDVLHQLEAGETSGKADKLIDDLPLFSVVLQQEKPKPQAAAKDSELVKAVVAISPDELTPREALELVYKLKELAGRA